MSDIALVHGLQAVDEIRRVVKKRIPEIRCLEKSINSMGLPPNKRSWSKSLYLLSSVLYAEAVEKNRKAMKEGFGEKTDPRLDSFVDYLVANKVDKEMVEAAIVEQLAIVDQKDNSLFDMTEETIVSAKMIHKSFKPKTTEELSDWHNCYTLFRTANGIFLLGVDSMVRGDFVSGLERLTECYLLNKRISEMTPTTLNRYKMMNRRGFYINLCVQYCNDYLMTKFESGVNRVGVVKEITEILVPAIIILQEKAIASPSGPETKNLNELRSKWEDIDQNSKNQWDTIVNDALVDSVGSDDASPVLSKHRFSTFQSNTGSLALNKFYGGYMEIVRKWKVSVYGMGLEDMTLYIQRNMDKMVKLDFLKKLLAHEKNSSQVLVRMRNIKEDGDQMIRDVQSTRGYILGRGRGRVMRNCQLTAMPNVTVVPFGRRGRGRGVRNTAVLEEVGNTVRNDQSLENVNAERDLPEDNSLKDTKISKKERKRLRKQIQNQQRQEQKVPDDNQDRTPATTKQQDELKNGSEEFAYAEDEVLDRLVDKFRSNLVVTKKEVENKHIIKEFEEIAGGVIKRAANEFGKKIVEIKSLKDDQVSLRSNLSDLKGELAFHKDKVKGIIEGKSKEMDAVLNNLQCFETAKVVNNKAIKDIDEKLKILELKKLSLREKENEIDSRMQGATKQKNTIQTFLNSEKNKLNEIEADMNNKIDALICDAKKIDVRISNVKNFKNPEDDTKVNPNTMMIKFMEKTIQDKEKQLECPVCFNVAKGAIFSCSESHLVCGSCRPKLKLCPECRIAYKEQKRHRYAEMIAKELETLRYQKEKLEKSFETMFSLN